MLRHYMADQPMSAVKKVTELGLRLGDLALVDVIVGMTPAQFHSPEGLAQLHFCSLEPQRLKVIRHGDGKKPIPSSSSYPVTIDRRLVGVEVPCVVRMAAIVYPDGRILSFMPEQPAMAVVAIPERIIRRQPDNFPPLWTRPGSVTEIAYELNCSDAREMFRRHAVLVS